MLIYDTFSATTALDCTSTVVDLVFLIDTSGSICNDAGVTYCDNWGEIRNFTNLVIDQLTIGPSNTRVGLVQFGTLQDTKSIFFLNTYTNKTSLKEAVSRLEYRPFQTTFTGTGINLVMSEQFTAANGDRSDRKNILLLITDGRTSTGDPVNAITAANNAKSAGVEILAVGVTNNVNVQELRDISSSPQRENETYWVATDFSILSSVANEVTQQTCNVVSTGKLIVVFSIVCDFVTLFGFYMV